ncbi:MAG: hypothetical protein H0T79_09645 [Deltaproteobacteria bacterium]|nr:hypothetical protein [Deltaproteobacteria bacterium]
MSNRPDLADLRVLGASTTEVWAGANEPASRGLVAWAGRAIGDDRALAVRAAFAACKLVTDTYPAAPADAAPKSYIDTMLRMVQAWLDDPTRERQEAAMKTLDITRQQHAWHGREDLPYAWILEAVDHACLTVWSGSDLSIYITPAPPRTCAARAAGCVFRALVASGTPEADAAAAVVAAVADETSN